MSDEPGPSRQSTSTATSDESLAALLSGGGFAVYPLSWCPHLAQLYPIVPEEVATKGPCKQCGDIKENWLCLHCFSTSCSRYVGQHQLAHFSETKHALALSYSDLSVWCYQCDNYVDNEVLYTVKNKAHMDKFDGEKMMKPDYGGSGLEMV